MHFSTVLAASMCAFSPLVAGHAAIIRATGDQGGNGSAIGIVGDTPRDGTNRNPFQADSTRFRGDAADTCGETIGAGTNDAETGTQKVLADSGSQLPQVSSGGQLTMTLHQVNSDGAGPYTCMMDPTGTGTQWTQINVAQNVPGNKRGRDKDGEVTDFSLVADMPAGMTCTGTVAGQNNVCMVRCQNPARAGPFGGCVPVQQANAAGAAAGAAGAATPAAGAAATPAAGAAAGASTPAAGAGTAAGASTAGTAAGAGTAGTAAGAGTAGTAGTAAGAGTAGTAAGAGTAGTAGTGQTSAGAADSAAADAADAENDEEDKNDKKKRDNQTPEGVADSAAADSADAENEAEDELERQAEKLKRRVKFDFTA